MGGVSSFFELLTKKHIPMPTPSLKKFIANVPTCTQRMNIATVLGIFSQVKSNTAKNQSCYTDRLVVVNEQQRPLGVLYLSSLLPYLGVGIGLPLKEPEKGKNQEIDFPTDAESAIDETSQPELNLRQSLSDLGLSIVQPLAIVPAELTLKQFWPYLQESDRKTNSFSDWALVDKAGKFLGLLDSEYLLQFVAKGIIPENLPDNPSLEHSTATLSGVSQNTNNSLSSLSPLVELLERLPLPIMLQTSNGRSISQNFAWRQHFGALADPELIKREAAALLEKVPNSGEASKIGDWTQRVSTFSNFDFSTLSASLPKWEESDRLDSSLDGPLPQVCHLGNHPNTCFCVCTMQNGSERVWQFVKIPLDNFLANPEVLWADKFNPKTVLEEILSAENLHLATIGANNDDTGVVPPILRTPHESGYSSYRSQYEALKLKLTQQKSQQKIPNNSLWLMLATDVTEQQQVAKELAAKNADLIQLNRLKDEFLACISHELKTPLTAVLGLSSLLKDQLLGELNDRQIRYTKLIHQSARHLMTVVNDILDLTRMETGQLELTLAPVDILAVCDRAYQQARQLYLGKNKTEEEELNASTREPNFTLLIEPGLDSLIADELRLRQMLVNLISNGLKFTEENGAIGLRVSRWEGWIAFTVWDTGIGIPDRKQHLIFQKFQQLENPLTRQFDGTGLGLVLTQRLARLHGGDVTFISKVGTGSEFTLLLPPSPPKKTWKTSEHKNNPTEEADQYLYSTTHHLSSPVYGETEVTVSHPTIPSRIVLLVEATPKLIEDLSQQLLGLGYRIVIARSGTEALEKARRLQPCAIFLNPLLPLLSGWDVLTLLKASAQTQHIPVIVTATVAEKEYAYSKRADSFLSLPVQIDALQTVLETIVIPNKVAEKGQPAGTGLTILRICVNSVDRGVVSSNDRNQIGEEISSLEISSEEHSQYPENDRTLSHLHPDLSRLLHQYNYRVLEADDLEQGELLARIWQPDVVLLDGRVANSSIYIEQLSQRDALASLPLVILDEQMAQAAMQVSFQNGQLPLQVFPCLPTRESSSETTTLLEAIQVAAGMTCKPTILVVDIANLPDLRKSLNKIESTSSDSPANQEHNLSAIASSHKKRSEWLQALIQYLQTAEFKAIVGHSWAEVLRQVQHHSIDLLLIDLGNSLPDYSVLVQAFDSLRCIGQKPPTLVLAKHFNTDNTTENFSPSVTSSIEFLEPVVREVAAKILPTSLSMEELLEEIRHTLS